MPAPKRTKRAAKPIPTAHKVGGSSWVVQRSGLDTGPSLMFIRREIISVGPHQIVTEGIGGRLYHRRLSNLTDQWHPPIMTKAEARTAYLADAERRLKQAANAVVHAQEDHAEALALDPSPELYEDWSQRLNGGKLSPTVQARALIRRHGEDAYRRCTVTIDESRSDADERYHTLVRSEIRRLTEVE